MKLKFAWQIFEKNIQISNFVKICPVEAALFHADRRRDATKLVVAFRNFANAPRMTYYFFHSAVTESLLTFNILVITSLLQA